MGKYRHSSSSSGGIAGDRQTALSRMPLGAIHQAEWPQQTAEVNAGTILHAIASVIKLAF